MAHGIYGFGRVPDETDREQLPEFSDDELFEQIRHSVEALPPGQPWLDMELDELTTRTLTRPIPDDIAVLLLARVTT
jgi:hypothetical protein